MAYAKVDVAFIRDHFSDVDEKRRPAAIALYFELVLASAEMLLDGNVPRRVVEAGAHEIGISRGRYSRREIASAATSLVGCGVVEIATDSMWRLVYWHDHHSSRTEVDDARKAAAERKRKSRGQMTLTDERGGQPSDVTQEVTEGQDRDSRAHVRRRSAANTKKDPSLHEPELDHHHTSNPDDEEPDLEDPAAAEESPTESTIRAACTRFRADLNVVEPLARQLTTTDFAALVTKHTAKVQRGSADSTPALFVHLLKTEVKTRAKTIAAEPRLMPPTRLSEDERPVKVEGDDWIRHIVPTLNAHPLERVESFITARSTTEAWTDEQLTRRLELARTLHAEREPDLDHAA